MRKNMMDVLDYLKSNGAEYADFRIVDRQEEKIITDDLTVASIINSRSKGFGIRVIYQGSLGFASGQDFEKAQEIAEKALEIAKASRSLQKEKIVLAKKDVVEDSYITPILIDPFTISKTEKIELLFAAERAMRETENLARTAGSMYFKKEDKTYADTEGSFITQTLYEAGAGIEAYASSEKDMQIRSYPASFGGNYATAGYEYIKSLKLVENAPKIAKEVVELLKAEECPSGHFDLIIDSSQLMLQIHESIGHPIELDRVFGSEAAYAGMSFVNVDMPMEEFRYGSQHVTITADATIPMALGTFGYDDDGVKAKKTVIIEKGIFKNFISSRDTASKINQLSTGTNRADGWQNLPIVRMNSINLMPGKFELEELIKGVNDGLYLSTNKSWSIDDKRLNFQFATEIAYEIKDGKLTGKIYKNPLYAGITPEFWGSCDGVCNEKYWSVYGVPNCGKGQPGQSAHVSHGSAPARFRNVKVGVKDAK